MGEIRSYERVGKPNLSKTKYWAYCFVECTAVISVTVLAGFAGEMLGLFIGFVLFQMIYQTWKAQKNEDYLEWPAANLSPKGAIMYAMAVGGVGGMLLSVWQVKFLGKEIYKNLVINADPNIVNAVLFTMYLIICTLVIILCVAVNKDRFLRPKEDSPLELEQANTVQKDELLPMTGDLTEETLRHNLSVLSGGYSPYCRARYSFTVEGYATKADKCLSDVMAYYDRLDQLITLGCDDAKEIAALRGRLDKARAEAYKSVKNIIVLLVILQSDSQVKDQIEAELARLEAITSEDGELSKSLREYTITQLQKPDPGPTTAEEIMRIISLSSSLLDGSRGQEMVKVSEIFPEYDQRLE